jgi:hypothetical protein
MQDSAETKPVPQRTWVQRVGALRVALAVLVLIMLPMAVIQGPSSEGLWVIPNQVLPGVVLIVIWVLPFDMVMSRVFLLGSDRPDHARYRSIVRLDLALLAALVAFWGPFFFSLLN